MSTPTIQLEFEDESLIPLYATEHAAGADVRAYLKSAVEIAPGERKLIPTGLRMAIPEGYEVQLRPRSGLALKHGLTLLNSPGTIDADYRGDVGVILINHSNKTFLIEPGMRIAQLILAPAVQARFQKESALSITTRGEGGFGHSGTQ